MKEKTILCAIDFSESSVKALEWAMREAKLIGATVTILFCYRLIADEHHSTRDLKKSIEQRANLRFQQIETEILNPQAPAYQFITEVGFFSSRIASLVESIPVCLIAFGTSLIKNFTDEYNPGFEEFLLRSEIPVVVIPEGKKKNENLELGPH